MLAQRKLLRATRAKQVTNSSSDFVSWLVILLAKKDTAGMDCFSNIDKTIALQLDESEGKGVAPIGRPRTKRTDSFVREITLPSKTISADL